MISGRELVNKMSELEKKKSEDEAISMPHRGGRTGQMVVVAIAVVAVVIIAALASGMLSTGGRRDSVTLTGAGATFPMPLILEWSEAYYNETGGKVKINYGGGGSGAGVTQIKGKTVDFAGSDAPLSASDSNTYGIVHIPETLGAVVVAYNLPGMSTTLRLDGPVLAMIFMKNITRWNDPLIAALNPTMTLPDHAIQTVARSDSSGTTFVFSGYLTKVSVEFANTYGQAKSINWPSAIGANGNPGVTTTVKSTEYSVGYVELTYAMQNTITFAQLKNKDGNFVTASLDSTSAAASGAGSVLPTGDGDWSQVNILDASGASSYPIASFTYILIYKELYNDTTRMNKTAAKDLVEFIWWAVHDSGQSYSNGLNYARLPAAVVSLNEETLHSITYQGSPLL